MELPRLDGIETIRRLTRDCPGTRVVVLTSHEGDADIFPAIHAGALSYLLKAATPDELRGGHAEAPNALRDLTERELEVLRLLGRGCPTPRSPRLMIGDKTVKTHVSAILMKLALTDRTQAAVHARRHGVLRRETDPRPVARPIRQAGTARTLVA